MPRADDLDLDFLARTFKLSGGNIRNIASRRRSSPPPTTAPVAMARPHPGTEREYRKLGRLTVEAEFGSYLELVTG